MKSLSTADKIFVVTAILTAAMIPATCLIGDRPDWALIELGAWSYFGFYYTWNK